MENITENNKLIADFLGWKKGRGTNTHKKTFLVPNKGGVYPIEALKFHNDWNWLIPVVEKIEIQSKELFGAYEDVIINGCGCGIATKDDMISIAATSKIEAVYMACVEYIKWYNEKNKTNESL